MRGQVDQCSSATTISRHTQRIGGDRYCCGYGFTCVCNTIVVRIDIGIVTDAIAVTIGALVGVIWKLIGVIANTVAIRIRTFVRIVGERVTVITNAIAIAIRRFIRIVRECVAVVTNPIAIRIS